MPVSSPPANFVPDKFTTFIPAASDFWHDRLVSKSIADLTGYDTGDLFEVTGDVLVQVWGVTGTAITCTSATTTLAVGINNGSQAILANTTINNSTNFIAGSIWLDTSPTSKAERIASTGFVIISDGENIRLTRSTDDITAGSMVLYCMWRPLSALATVTAA